MFDGFTQHRIECDDGIGVHALIAGSGPPLLLLHGCPQTSVMWREVAPRLTDRFTVVVPDLRGYGASSKPAGAPDHSPTRSGPWLTTRCRS